MEGTEGNPKADPEADPEAAAEPMKKKRRPKGPDPDAFSALLSLSMRPSVNVPSFPACMPRRCCVSTHVLREHSLKLVYDTFTYGHVSGRRIRLQQHLSCVNGAVLPAREVLEIAQANPPGPRPLPNLG